jgi:excinuclease ABC subunit B
MPSTPSASRCSTTKSRRCSCFDPLTGHLLHKLLRFTVFPASHYVTPRATVLRAIEAIKEELRERIDFFHPQQTSWSRRSASSSAPASISKCSTRSASARASKTTPGIFPGASRREPPPTLIDYLPADALMFIDESHVTIGQVGGMYKGDRSRKENLVDYGFRLPSALDNRPAAVQGIRSA